MPSVYDIRHIFLHFPVKKFEKYLEIRRVLLYLCDIKMISSKSKT
mgnify:CR=1 FL=1